MSAESIHNTLERLCNLLRVEAREAGAAAGLLPIQFEALHYLVQCNRYSNTVQGVSEFLGQTKGTVSKTVAVLEDRGLIERIADSEDRRVVHLIATVAGKRMLKKVVPAGFLLKALAVSKGRQVEVLDRALKDLLLAAQRVRASKSFGACKSCRFNEQADGRFKCGLTGEALAARETEMICREHEYPVSAV